jgi:transcriptional regulator with XRE-family HTH domain
MNIGSIITQLRKEKGVSRDDLGTIVGTSGAVIGRYEREEITPSVEIANKIAQALNVSLDYLVGNNSVMVKDKKIT